jgi:ADP-ribose pyrophosphatase
MAGAGDDGRHGGHPPVGRLRFEILGRERLYEGFFGLDLLRLRHQRFDGTWSPELGRELWCQRRAVTVLPYDPVHDRVVLVEQFRTGLVDDPEGPWLLEAPAGLVEPGEGPEEVARRELQEECGLEALRLVRAAVYHSSPGSTSERVTAFVAEVRDPQSGLVAGRPDEHEDILSHVVKAEEAFAWVECGRVTASTAVITLLWLQNNRQRLRAEWLSATSPEA